MLNYCVIKDNNLLAQFRDERDAKKFAKETGGKLAILGFREVNTDIVDKPKKEGKSYKPVVDISKVAGVSAKQTPEEKPKRKRRTKAEMQEARRLEALAKMS